ncbi:uncharacterized protein [Spinacia oleracea]|nr:uncharacterized protein LOC130470656 [Spinacia oleracea]
MHDLYSVTQSATELVECYRSYQRRLKRSQAEKEKLQTDLAESVRTEGDCRKEIARLELDVIAAGNRKAELELLPAKLTAEEQKTAELQIKLDAALQAAQDAEKAAKDDRKAVALKAVQKFMKSDFYCEEMKGRYNGGWTAAHRCAVKALTLTEDAWGKVEGSYEEGGHIDPTGMETQTFPDIVIQNADPRLLPDREIPESAYWSDADYSA